MSNIVIEQEFVDLIPFASEDEDRLLEEELVKDGFATDPLIVWKGRNILLDGHRRYRICTKHGLRFDIKEMEFATKDDAKRWMLLKQLARRNLKEKDRAMLISQLMAMVRATVSDTEAAKQVAEMTGQDKRTIYRAQAYEQLYEALPEQWQTALKTGKVTIPREHYKPMKLLADEGDEESLFTLLAECLTEGSSVPIKRRFSLTPPSRPMALPGGTPPPAFFKPVAPTVVDPITEGRLGPEPPEVMPPPQPKQKPPSRLATIQVLEKCERSAGLAMRDFDDFCNSVSPNTMDQQTRARIHAAYRVISTLYQSVRDTLKGK